LETVLKDRGTEQSWQIFKDTFHRALELSVPGCKQSGKEGKRPAWLESRPAGQTKGQEGTAQAG